MSTQELMQYKNYYGSVHFNAQDLILYGKLEFIRALVSYEADNAKGLKKAFEEAVDDYLDTCHHQKIEPEIPFKGSLNVRLGFDLHRRVAIAAAQQDITINKFVKKTLNQAIPSTAHHKSTAKHQSHHK